MATAGCRFSLGMTFSSEAEKDAVKLRVDSARRILFPDESTSRRPVGWSGDGGVRESNKVELIKSGGGSRRGLRPLSPS